MAASWAGEPPGSRDGRTTISPLRFFERNRRRRLADRWQIDSSGHVQVILNTRKRWLSWEAWSFRTDVAISGVHSVRTVRFIAQPRRVSEASQRVGRSRCLRGVSPPSPLASHWLSIRQPRFSRRIVAETPRKEFRPPPRIRLTCRPLRAAAGCYGLCHREREGFRGSGICAGVESTQILTRRISFPRDAASDRGSA